MQDKLLTVMVYLAIGAYLALLLARNLWTLGADVRQPTSRWLAPVCAVAAAVVFLAFSTPFAGWLAVGLAGASAMASVYARNEGKNAVDWASTGVLAAIFCIAASLAWWRRTGPAVDVSLPEQLFIQLLLIAATRLFLRTGDPEPRHSHVWSAALVMVFLATIIVLFSTGLYENAWVRWVSWHHWGAYIGPAQLALLGIPVLHDIPVQYGVGPTALVALTCGKDCWYGMYFLVGGLNLLYGMLMVIAALRVADVRRASGQMLLIVLSVFLSTMVWTSYPPSLGSPSLTPSVSGLRFLPLALLLVALLRRSDDGRGELPEPVLHLLWLLGVLWSPESAFQTTVLWWPYYVWTRTWNRPAGASRLRSVVLANARLGGWLFAGTMVFLLGYWSICRVLPRWDVYAAYVLHPPGVIPVSPFGTVWFFGCALVAAFIGLALHLRNTPPTRPTKNLVISLLAAYGASSYFLGRSHDNNLLNISVFFVILLLAVRAMARPQPLRMAACGMLACLIAYVALINGSMWTQLLQEGRLAKFHPARTTAGFSYVHPDGIKASQIMMAASSSEAFGQDVSRGMRTITAQFHEPVVVLDPSLSLEGGEAGQPWSAFHGPENYVYLPSPLRQRFLASVAARLRASGWVLVKRDYPAAELIADLDAVYRRDRLLDFGSYYAIRYIPRPG